MRTRTGLIVAAVVSVLAPTLGATGIAPHGLREALAIPALMLAPGYALLVATGLLGSLAFWQKVAYSVGASLGLAVLAGVVLGALGLFTTAAVAILFAALTLALVALALRRERSAGDAPARPPMRLLPAQVVLFCVALLVTGAAFAVAVRGANRQDERQKFAELWLVPPEPQQDTLRVGAQNRSTAAAAYTLRVFAGARPIRNWTLTLAPGQRFGADIPEAAVADSGARAVLLDSAGATVRRVSVGRSTLASALPQAP